MRQLRQDLATTTLSMQRTQILLYRLQLSGAAMTRATASPNMIANLKKDMENWTPQLQDAQTKQIDAEAQLRAEQARRDALEAALDKLDKQLEAATAARQ